MNADASLAARGYRWPAEWEPHTATWVAWPHNVETWPGNYEPIPGRFVEFVRAIAEVEPVRVLAGGSARSAAEQHLQSIANVDLCEIPTNDTWCRDHGPTFLQSPRDQPRVLLDWRFNSWGNKYPPFDKDDAVPTRIATSQNWQRVALPLTLEGGAVEGNGQKRLITTASCLLNPNRNPDISREEVIAVLRDHLAVNEVLWLPRSELAGDDTDGHVDQLARFVRADTVVAATSVDEDEESVLGLRANLHFLRSRNLEVIELPLPEPKFFQEHRLPASYCNFYIANGRVIVPQFEDPTDQLALGILREAFPHHEILGLPALELVWGLGAFHCLTQQEPAPLPDNVEADFPVCLSS